MKLSISEKSFDNKSWFKAGNIIRYLVANKEKDIIQYGVGYNENVFEICTILQHYTTRHIKLIPLKYGFSVYLIKNNQERSVCGE